MSATLVQVSGIIVEELEVALEVIKMESLIVDDLGADSLDVVELIMRLEEKFEIEIPDEAVEKIHTVGDIVRFIDENK